MLDLKFIREDIDELRRQIARRGMEIDIEALQEEEAERRQLLQAVEDLRQRRNVASREIAVRKKNGEDASSEIALMKEVADRIKELEQKMRDCEKALLERMAYIPNLPHPSVPAGKTEADNEEVRRSGELPVFRFYAPAALGNR